MQGSSKISGPPNECSHDVNGGESVDDTQRGVGLSARLLVDLVTVKHGTIHSKCTRTKRIPYIAYLVHVVQGCITHVHKSRMLAQDGTLDNVSDHSCPCDAMCPLVIFVQSIYTCSNRYIA